MNKRKSIIKKSLYEQAESGRSLQNLKLIQVMPVQESWKEFLSDVSYVICPFFLWKKNAWKIS